MSGADFSSLKAAAPSDSRTEQSFGNSSRRTSRKGSPRVQAAL
jgi:hypothetical protein